VLKSLLLNSRPSRENLADVRETIARIQASLQQLANPWTSYRPHAFFSGTRADIAIKLFGDDLNKMFANRNPGEKSAIVA